MKKVITVIVVFFIVTGIKAQPWFDIGIKGGVGTSFMNNFQILDEQYLSHKFRPGYTYGGKLGFNFIQEHQITFDVMKTSINQGFNYTIPDVGEKYREYNIESFDMALMYRANKNGTYFEVGPQWSKVTKVGYKDDGGDFISPVKPDDLINESLVSLVVGFGGYIVGTDNFGISTGIRLAYNLTDIATETGRGLNFPMLVDHDPNPTRNLSAMFVIEMNYDFGYLVSPTCGKRGKLFVF